MISKQTYSDNFYSARSKTRISKFKKIIEKFLYVWLILLVPGVYFADKSILGILSVAVCEFFLLSAVFILFLRLKTFLGLRPKTTKIQASEVLKLINSEIPTLKHEMHSVSVKKINKRSFSWNDEDVVRSFDKSEYKAVRHSFDSKSKMHGPFQYENKSSATNKTFVKYRSPFDPLPNKSTTSEAHTDHCVKCDICSNKDTITTSSIASSDVGINRIETFEQVQLKELEALINKLTSKEETVIENINENVILSASTVELIDQVVLNDSGKCIFIDEKAKFDDMYDFEEIVDLTENESCEIMEDSCSDSCMELGSGFESDAELDFDLFPENDNDMMFDFDFDVEEVESEDTKVTVLPLKEV